jgi:peptidyl-prolyl cis-trans isomerase SurA
MGPYRLALWLLAASPGEWTTVERVVAVVADDIVLASELDRRVALAGRAGAAAPADLRRHVLLALVDERLIAQEAARISVDVQDADVDAAIAMLKAQNGLDDAAYARALADAGQTAADHRAHARRELLRLKLFMALLPARIQISTADLEAAHAAEKANNPALGDLAAESERLRAALYQRAFDAEAERWLAEARRRARIDLRP